MSRTPAGRRDRALYVEIFIAAPMERVWELTQDPVQHARWDGRFSAIRPTRLRADGAQEFRYELGLGVHTIRGTGVSLGEKRAKGGSRTSALLFTTADALSPLGTGRGYWRYLPERGGVRFITGYDYAPGWGWLGRVLDPIVTRRFVWWLTAWSFDRLRIWAESGIEPERIGWWRGWVGGTRARAANCRSRPEREPRAPAGAAHGRGDGGSHGVGPRVGGVMADAPAALAGLSLTDPLPTTPPHAPPSRRAEQPTTRPRTGDSER